MEISNGRDKLSQRLSEGVNLHQESESKEIHQIYFLFLQNKDLFVVARFDLQKTWRELLIAVLVPSVMFIASSATLCIITRSVNVGDDTKMRCTYCVGSPDMNDEDQRQSTRNNTNECLLSPSDENVRTNSRYKY
jgi:hypothetical protein